MIVKHPSSFCLVTEWDSCVGQVVMGVGGLWLMTTPLPIKLVVTYWCPWWPLLVTYHWYVAFPHTCCVLWSHWISDTADSLRINESMKWPWRQWFFSQGKGKVFCFPPKVIQPEICWQWSWWNHSNQTQFSTFGWHGYLSAEKRLPLSSFARGSIPG